MIVDIYIYLTYVIYTYYSKKVGYIILSVYTKYILVYTSTNKPFNIGIL